MGIIVSFGQRQKYGITSHANSLVDASASA
jgi:hypothetical protein